MKNQNRRPTPPPRHVREGTQLPGDVIRSNPARRPFKLASKPPEIERSRKESADVVRSGKPQDGRSRRPAHLVTCLSPNRVSESMRTIEIPEVAWKAVMKLSAQAGYAVFERAGFGPDESLWLRKALGHAVAKEIVPDELLGLVEKLIDFLQRDGKGGFGVSGRWRG